MVFQSVAKLVVQKGGVLVEQKVVLLVGRKAGQMVASMAEPSVDLKAG